MDKIARLFLIAEGGNAAFPNYSTAKLHLTAEDPCNLSLTQQFVCSPIFSALQEGANSIPDISLNTSITFVMMPRIYPDMQEVISKFDIQNELWFSLGLANVVIIEKEGGELAKNIIQFLQNKSNITASETWLIHDQTINKHTCPHAVESHLSTEFQHITLSVSEHLPLNIKFAVSEFKVLSQKFLTGSKKFTPHFFSNHQKVIAASKQFIEDLSFLHGDYQFNPDESLLSGTPPVNCLLSETWRHNSFARKQSCQKMNWSGSKCLQA